MFQQRNCKLMHVFFSKKKKLLSLVVNCWFCTCPSAQRFLHTFLKLWDFNQCKGQESYFITFFRGFYRLIALNFERFCFLLELCSYHELLQIYVHSSAKLVQVLFWKQNQFIVACVQTFLPSIFKCPDAFI